MLFTTLIVAGVAVGVAALAVIAVIVIRSHRRQVRDRAVRPSSRASAGGRPVAAIPAPPLLLPDEEPDQGLAEPLGLDEAERDLALP